MDQPVTIGRYEVERLLGSGGMGVVYLARDPAIPRKVAIKVLRTDDEEYRRRFKLEVNAAGALRHRHIITLFDSGEHEGSPFLVMEFVPGDTLAEKIKRREPLSVSEKLRYIEELCEGLAHAHKAGIIHRDIKPANVIVDADSNSVKIVDFGIARVTDASVMTESGLLMGTPGYMSPEQVMGKRSDHRSDIFAAGLVLYELLSYRRAFDGGLDEGFVYRLLHDEPDDIATLVPGISADVTTIVRRALRKDPAERYDSIADMASAIRQARRPIGNESTNVTLPQLGPGPPPPLGVSTAPELQVPGEGGTGIDRRLGRVRVNVAPSDKRLRWSLATAVVLAIVALGLYRLGTGDAGTSQPRPTTVPSTESALQLNAVMTVGGKPLPSGVGYDVYEAATDADGKRKPVTESAPVYGPPQFPLPAGRYYVTATYGSAAASTELSVSPAELTRQTLNLRAGILRLTSVLSAGGKPLPSGVGYDVYEAATDADGKRKPVTESAPVYGPPQFTLPAGRYYVTATYGNAFAGAEVSITAGDEPVRQILDLHAGVLSLTSVLSAGGKPLPNGVGYDVYEAATDADGKRKLVTESARVYGPPQFPLPAGRYYVTATYGSASAGAEVSITAGDEPVRQILDLHAGVLSLTSVLSAGGKPLPNGVGYDVYEAATDADGKRKLVTESARVYGPPQFPLPAGRYYVTAAYGSASAGAEVSITAGDEPVRQILDLHAGVLSLTSVLSAGGKPLPSGVGYDVYEAATDADGKRKLVTESARVYGPPQFSLPAGRYYVTASSDAGKGDSEVTIAAGETRQVQLRLSRENDRN